MPRRRSGQQLEVARQAAWPDAEQDAPADSWRAIATSPAIRRRVSLGQIQHAGAEPDVLGRSIRLARKTSGEVICSALEVQCSPTQTSS